jgi:hypothetical protein
MFEVEGTRERRLVVGYRQLTSRSFFSALSDLYHFYGLTSSRKYVEQFSNGVTVIGIYLVPTSNTGTKFPPIETSIYQVFCNCMYAEHRSSKKHLSCTAFLSLNFNTTLQVWSSACKNVYIHIVLGFL